MSTGKLTTSTATRTHNPFVTNYLGVNHAVKPLNRHIAQTPLLAIQIGLRSGRPKPDKIDNPLPCHRVLSSEIGG